MSLTQPPPVEHDDIPSPLYKPHLFVPSISPSINAEQSKTANETKTSSIDPSKIDGLFFISLIHLLLDILAAVLGGIAIAIFSVNIVVCYICKR